MKKKSYPLFFVGLLFICGLFFYQQTTSRSAETTVARLQVTGAVTDSSAAQACLTVLKQNLQGQPPRKTLRATQRPLLLLQENLRQGKCTLFLRNMI